MKENLSQTLKNIKLSILSLYSKAKALKSHTISSEKTYEVDNILWT